MVIISNITAWTFALYIIMVISSIVRALPRRFLNSPYPRDFPLPKRDRWWKRQRIFRFSGWYYSDARDKYRVARNRVHHAWQTMTRNNKNYPAMMNWFHKKRAAAGAAEFGLDYPSFTRGLSNANIRLNDKMLSILACTEPRTFRALVEVSAEVLREKSTDEAVGKL
ncbi:hypothetical protein M514_04072 [Trichuris suis]|uniref:50S ribosomal protein L20 n=1 Tax=Trichuris suis TaxID=68888 RepID=A0A085NSP5_9BILA|nr:hypothetical protein M513_04072 [Trichuris suis]KFD72491.1 hypothetical protein M514_04072 [Trichuris suis]KHJ48797.1 putative ribosomal protein L20 [Trichuris suis]